VESPVRAWLELQCQMIAGAEAGLVMLGSSEPSAGPGQVVSWPFLEPAGPRLSATVERALERGKLEVQVSEDGTDAAAATALVAVPVEVDGCICGAAGVSVRGVPPAELKALAGLLGYGAQGLAQLIQAQSRYEPLADRLALAGDLLEGERLAEAAHAFAVRLAQSMGCERVAVGLRRRERIRVVGLSTTPRFAEESDAVGDLVSAMQEAVDQDAVLELPAPPDAPVHSLHAHEGLTRSTGAGAVCTVPLASRGRSVGAFTCEWREASELEARLRSRMREAGVVCGPILELMSRAEAGPLERVGASLLRWSERHFGADPTLRRGALAAVGALLVLLALVPAPYRISARATIEGRVQRALVAGVTGYVAEANARAGDLVRAGDVIARLDDRDLRLERSRRASEVAQLQKEHRGALAGRERTQVSILEAKLDRAAAELGLAEEQLGRTAVAAPFDGIILKGDLDRSLGSPVELGSVLFEIAPLDGYRIIIEVDGRDINDVAVNQRGRLALAALPGHALPLVVERITPISTVQDGRSYFRVEAVLEEPMEELRPGMEGIAKIEAGRRRLLWIWTHEMIDWLRLLAWGFLP